MKKINYIILLILVPIIGVSCKNQAKEKIAESDKVTANKPNIVVIYLDDQGKLTLF